MVAKVLKFERRIPAIPAIPVPDIHAVWLLYGLMYCGMGMLFFASLLAKDARC